MAMLVILNVDDGQECKVRPDERYNDKSLYQKIQ
jgi:hypothetical protein